MITAIEQAVAAVLTDALAEDAALAAVPYVVRTATSRETVPGDRTIVAVRVQQGERQMESLADPIAEIIVATPAVNEGATVAGHSAVEQAVDRVFVRSRSIGEDEESITITEALAAEIEDRLEGWTGAGFFNQGWQPGREDTQWMPVLSVKIGAIRE
jgi:hypothetical protein